jgi:hypothetical protein
MTEGLTIGDHSPPSFEEEERLFEKAVALFNECDDAEAETLFHYILTLGSNRAAAAREYLERIEVRCDEKPFAEAVHLFGRGRYASAEKFFEQVLKLKRRRQDEALQYLQFIAERRSKLFMIEEIAPVRGLRQTSHSSLIEAAKIDLSELPAPIVIKQTPHMDINPAWPVPPGDGVSVSIYIDGLPPRAGEVVEDINFEALLDTFLFNLEVRLLASAHFVFETEAVKPLVITRNEERSSTVTFDLRVKTTTELADAGLNDTPAGVTAIFAFANRTCGKVGRKIEIAAVARQSRVEDSNNGKAERKKFSPKPQATLQFEAFTDAPELIVEIVKTPANDGRQYWCIVRTPHYRKYAGGVTGDWNLDRDTADTVNEYLGDFTIKGSTNAYRMASLRAAGKDFFKVSPKIFQRVFWELIDASRPPQTIAIVSEEPHIPWELMIPRRELGGHKCSRPPLGVEFRVGRWTPKTNRWESGVQKIPMVDSYVIAPQYVDKPVLKHAQKESDFVLKAFPPGKAITPVNFDNICAAFKCGGSSILHIACHGVSASGKPQALYLESPPPLSSHVVRGVEEIETAFDKKRPFVFLNACEVGRLTPGLVGVGGFAESFIELGASAVIAPLWSVKDDLAHQVAMEFYNRVLNEPHIPFAEIIRQIRAKAFDPAIQEDTYAAYCFYGDPMSTRATGIAVQAEPN